MPVPTRVCPPDGVASGMAKVAPLNTPKADMPKGGITPEPTTLTDPVSEPTTVRTEDEIKENKENKGTEGTEGTEGGPGKALDEFDAFGKDKDREERDKLHLRRGSFAATFRVSNREIDIQTIGELLSAKMILSFRLLWRRSRVCTRRLVQMVILGGILEFVQREIMYNYGDGAVDDMFYVGIIHIQYTAVEMYYLVHALRCLMTLSTMWLLYNLYQYFSIDHDFKGLSRAYLADSTHWPTDLRHRFALEAVTLSLHTLPFVDVYINTSLHGDISYMINFWGPVSCFLRMYLFIRLINSEYYSGGTKVIGLWNRFEFTTAFVIRNVLHDFPVRCITFLGLMMTLSCAYLTFLAERGPFITQTRIHIQGSEFGYGDAIWMTWITMSSVGYGDLFPVTSFGRVISMVASLFGMIFIAIVTATVIDQLTLFPYETRVVDFLQQAKAAKNTKVLAAKVIQRMWRYKQACRNAGVAAGAILKFNGKEFPKKPKLKRAQTTIVVPGGRWARLIARWTSAPERTKRQAIEAVFEFCEFRKDFKSIDQRKSNHDMLQLHLRNMQAYTHYIKTFFTHPGDKTLELSREKRDDWQATFAKRWNNLAHVVTEVPQKPKWFESDYDDKNKTTMEHTVEALRHAKAEIEAQEIAEEEEEEEPTPCIVESPLGEQVLRTEQRVDSIQKELEQMKQTQEQMNCLLRMMATQMGIKTPQAPLKPLDASRKSSVASPRDL